MGVFRRLQDQSLISWLNMADENETAPKPEKKSELEEDHGHCSDCENEEHHFDDG